MKLQRSDRSFTFITHIILNIFLVQTLLTDAALAADLLNNTQQLKPSYYQSIDAQIPTVEFETVPMNPSDPACAATAIESTV